MPRLLIIGASSGIGLAAVYEALANGYEVRAYARRASSIPLKDKHLQKIDADALDQRSIKSALAGCNAVVQSLGAPMNLKLLTGPVDLFSNSTRILVQEMEQSDVKRLVCVTGFGAGDCNSSIHWLQRPGFKLVFGRAYADKSEQENLIRKSGLQWTIARPGVLTNGPRSVDYQVLESPEKWCNGAISRRSVAHFMVQACTANTWLHQAPVLLQRRWF